MSEEAIKQGKVLTEAAKKLRTMDPESLQDILQLAYNRGLAYEKDYTQAGLPHTFCEILKVKIDLINGSYVEGIQGRDVLRLMAHDVFEMPEEGEVSDKDLYDYCLAKIDEIHGKLWDVTVKMTATREYTKQIRAVSEDAARQEAAEQAEMGLDEDWQCDCDEDEDVSSIDVEEAGED